MIKNLVNVINKWKGISKRKNEIKMRCKNLCIKVAFLFLICSGIVFANVVLPEPGLSSIRTLPSDNIAANVSLILFSFPTIIFETCLIKLSNIVLYC